MIPAYNEARRLPPSLERIFAWMDGERLEFGEVIVVDDGSIDGTAEAAEAVGAKHSCLRLLRNPGNRGKGYSVRAGMLEARGEWRLFTDADLSTPIEQARLLYEKAMETGADIAIGSRALDRGLVEVRQPLLREMSGQFFNLAMRAATGLDIHDTQCGFKLYRARAAQMVFTRQRLTGFSFDVEDLYLARRLGLEVVEVPVRWSNVEGTKVSAWKGLQSFADLARIRWNGVRGVYGRGD